jgi:hypothetical protein
MKSTCFFISLVFVAACSHTVHKLDVDRTTIDVIKAEAKSTCSDSCEIKSCWWENKDVLMCNVEFSFVTDGTKVRLLEATSEALAKKSFKVGFCGRDSFGTGIAAAFIGGIVSGVFSNTADGAIQGGDVVGGIAATSDLSEKVYMDKELVQKACDSAPVENKVSLTNM